MTSRRGIDSESAAFIISLIGVSNTVGRVIIGAFVDLPWVSSLIVTNISLIMSGICLLAFPFCYSYTSFAIVALMLGLFVSAFISLTSIVLVDLLGLDSLTSTFGILVMFRGIASILGIFIYNKGDGNLKKTLIVLLPAPWTKAFVIFMKLRLILYLLGPPLAGLVFDWTQEYDASFYMAGGFFIFGGILSFIAYFIDKWKRKS
jgi:predicted MFS family arabinose efflux permease